METAANTAFEERELITSYVSSELGTLLIRGTKQYVTEIDFLDEVPNDSLGIVPQGAVSLAVQQLSEYLRGERRRFELPLKPAGTPFQQSVWTELQRIGWGDTRTYLEVAAAVRNPKGVRAVGQAIGRNPISIVVPCHRVIGAGGKLTGYAGGLWRKEWLLDHERRVFGG